MENPSLETPLKKVLSPKLKPKARGRKRKRVNSSSSSESENVFPENALEFEKNVVASAVRNNLDDISVKKILKKVVTNDHVLALVKLREEEEIAKLKEDGIRPKLTRAKVKELMKASPSTAPWNLENLELTPIKHIPVKTRPEVTALIAQELPEDEDDEEYEPTHDDVPSDDEHGLESCSDLDSQPRTPATPRGASRTNGLGLKDGLFKIPEATTPVRRIINIEEEATIALRTRSKLSLSETPIEHIESSFVPPDDVPVPPVVDQLWSEFLSECLNPASISRHEDDDETDPEYNVAADPDAHDEDEEALENSIIKISKKELNDLVTELFNIMPEDSLGDELTEIENSVLTDHNLNETNKRWEGKQEPISDDEKRPRISDKLVFERSNHFSIGKTEPMETGYDDIEPTLEVKAQNAKANNISKGVTIMVQENIIGAKPPPSSAVPPLLVKTKTVPPLQVTINGEVMLQEQVAIFQQQLRQHIQIATSNFLQLFVNPLHWARAPNYKEYLESLYKMSQENPHSVVNVCNLRPAVDLINSWEKSVSKDTPENTAMVEFIQKEAERWRRRSANNCLYAGEFHETFKRVVANSSVFLYPHLLPPMPFRADVTKRFSYLRSEDELIAMGLDQFWQYVSDNPDLFKRPARAPARWGLTAATQLLTRYMFPWIQPKAISQHIQTIKKHGDKENPVYKFLTNREIVPVKHRLLPFNPEITLYEQPEHEVPRNWLRYLAKTSKRFRTYLQRRPTLMNLSGVEVKLGSKATPPIKTPLPIDFTKKIHHARINPPKPKTTLVDKFDVEIGTPMKELANPVQVYRLVQTRTGATLVPVADTEATCSDNKNKSNVFIVTNSDPTTILVSEESQSETSSATVLATTDNHGYSAIENNTDISNFIAHTTNSMNCATPNQIVDNRSICINGLNTHPVIETNIVNCNTNPIISPKEKNSSKQANLENHCNCCLLLKRICNVRQTVITDFFKKGRLKKKQCACKNRRYPKVSNRLNILVKRYKSSLKCTYNELQNRMAETKDEKNEISEDVNDKDDVDYVTAFQLKLIIRCSIARNTYIKKRVNTLFSEFNPDIHDPLKLAARLRDSFQDELADLNHDFLGFMTPEQADKMEDYKVYFLMNCAQKLLKKIDELILNKDDKWPILVAIRSLFSGQWTACAMCCNLLMRMTKYPELARFTFDLFPHLKYVTNAKQNNELTSPEPAEREHNTTEDPLERTLTNGDGPQSFADYEADHSSSGEDSCNEHEHSNEADSKRPATEKQNKSPSYVIDTAEMSITKPTVQEDDSSDNMSLMIMSEDEPIKAEPSEWKREEDKLILEVLKDHLTPAERQDKTTVEIIEDKQIVQILANSLEDKSKYHIKERILYILKMLLLGES